MAELSPAEKKRTVLGVPQTHNGESASPVQKHRHDSSRPFVLLTSLHLSFFP
jgi:hypothetical protein